MIIATTFLVYWSLTFAILLIWIFSIAVALADVKDTLWEKFRKQRTGQKAAGRAADPLAGRSVAETLTPRKMDPREEWILSQVSPVAAGLRLDLKILVLQDSMDHYLVHFAQGKKLTSYRVDKAWVADGMAGKTDQAERIRRAVERHLRVEFLGEKPAPPAPPSAPASAGAARESSAPSTPAPSRPAPQPPAGAGPQAPGGPTEPAGGSGPATPA
jgi:hypothetical protein